MQIVERQDEFSGGNLERNGSFGCVSPFIIIDTLSRKSFSSYNKLPQEPINLTILKLDSSSFQIQVANTGTVEELKQAVEAAFSHLPKKGPGKVSWPHVWGSFCLCYDGQKLLNNSDYLRNYGIQDGDELRFIRHVSINYNMMRTQRKKEVHNMDQLRMSSCRLDAIEERPQISWVDNNCDDEENLRHQSMEDNNVMTQCEYKLAHVFRGWFSYRKLTSPQTSFEQQESYSTLPTFKNGVLGSFRNIVRLYSNKYHSRLD